MWTPEKSYRRGEEKKKNSARNTLPRRRCRELVATVTDFLNHCVISLHMLLVCRPPAGLVVSTVISKSCLETTWSGAWSTRPEDERFVYSIYACKESIFRTRRCFTYRVYTYLSQVRRHARIAIPKGRLVSTPKVRARRLIITKSPAFSSGGARIY